LAIADQYKSMLMQYTDDLANGWKKLVSDGNTEVMVISSPGSAGNYSTSLNPT
jgi:hypothetical protein